jgi:thymidylate synthase (FAD)
MLDYLEGLEYLEVLKMGNHHDKLNIMSTEEILKRNVNDLQEQLVVANKRILSLKGEAGFSDLTHKQSLHHQDNQEIKKMEVTYIDHMGNDLSVINAARVSFGKRSVELGYDQIEIDGYQRTIPHICSKDERLLRYLALHNHWTPFAHTAITFHITAPLFIARQLGKHQVGLVWNEISRRYVDDEPTLYSPENNMWRMRADDKKQGSSDKTVHYNISAAHKFALQCYDNMLRSGIAPEQARMVLPQSMYTEWYWTGSLAAFHRVCTQRIANSSQKETHEVAYQISERCGKLFPISWRNLIEGGEYL